MVAGPLERWLPAGSARRPEIARESSAPLAPARNERADPRRPGVVPAARRSPRPRAPDRWPGRGRSRRRAPRRPRRPPSIQCPADEAPHQSLTEWWYYTGLLEGKGADGSARRYGFELTVFQTLRGRLPPYYVAHYAVTDLGRSAFVYDQRAEFGPRPNPGTPAHGLSLASATGR